MVILLIIGFITVTALQGINFLKEKQYKESAVYTVLMAFALIYAISGLTDWDFPTPSELTEIIFDPISDLVFNAHLKK